MKVIKKDNKKDVTDNNWEHLPVEVQNDLAFHASRTVFWKSFLFLIIEAAGPFLLLFLLTSPDLSFAYHYDVGAGIGFGLAMILGVFLLTCAGFWLKFHQDDQFTYTITLSWTLYGIYLTGYWWGWDKILYRCLVALVFLLLAVFFGTFMAVWMRNLRGYLQMKKTNFQELEANEQETTTADDEQNPPSSTLDP
ncbi:DxFTY motif-containing membrane protein [Spiroplasma endosymbiont of Sarcophaga carnaria]|uniref:DxFTY motif-containing membrane protein n=1 Tax=Spiroplasma endosymbiont of Sarcophaga carnaria TaxID=3066303 RepID=UPI0030CFDCB5